jgi:hypothetical protein
MRRCAICSRVHPREQIAQGRAPDPEPQTGPKETNTGPAAAVGFASKSPKYELEKRVLYALQGEPLLTTDAY